MQEEDPALYEKLKENLIKYSAPREFAVSDLSEGSFMRKNSLGRMMASRKNSTLSGTF